LIAFIELVKVSASRFRISGLAQRQSPLLIRRVPARMLLKRIEFQFRLIDRQIDGGSSAIRSSSEWSHS